MKGSISEFELGVLRARMLDAARAKARRGARRISVPIGSIWHREAGLGLDPDLRIQEVIRLLFARFRELGSARQVMLSMTADKLPFPRPSDGKNPVSFEWTPIRYRNVISVLKNPFYAGVYVPVCRRAAPKIRHDKPDLRSSRPAGGDAYGKSEKRTQIVDGRPRKSYGHRKPFDEWEVVLKDHHEGYIDWGAFERNQKQLALNAYGKQGGTKSGRGGRALLAGLVSCGRCGRRLMVSYSGRSPGQPVYRCERPNQMLGRPRCLTFGGLRVDAAIAKEVLRAVEPLAIEAALRRVETCETRLQKIEAQDLTVAPPDFGGLADDLDAAWHAPDVTMRARQRLLRALVTDIFAGIDEDARAIVLTIHWRGGQHSQLRVKKPRSGEHGCATTEDALAVMRSMAGCWSDERIAASLNRMGIPTGQGKTWTARRVGSVRRVRTIHAYRSADKAGAWLTMTEAAKSLTVTNHTIRRLSRPRSSPPRRSYQAHPIN